MRYLCDLREHSLYHCARLVVSQLYGNVSYPCVHVCIYVYDMSGHEPELNVINMNVQDESSMAIHGLVEKVEDNVRRLSTTQDRHTQQILDLKGTHSVDTQDMRDRLAQALTKVQGEIERNFREDRQARESNAQRMHEWGEQVRALERVTAGKLAGMEQTLRMEIDLARTDLDDAKHNSQVCL
jgi:hypothetical protein